MKVSTKVITLLLVILTSFGLSGSENHSLAQSNKSDKELPKTVTLDCGNGVEMVLTLIPAGTFQMGSPAEGAEAKIVSEWKKMFKNHHEENYYGETQHKVTLTKPFYIGIHPATQAQYQAVMGKNPSHFSPDYFEEGAGALRRPVDCVSWNDTQEFCKKLSAKTGRNVRLPTEAEWEYACRAGTTMMYSFGNTLTQNQAAFERYTHRKDGKVELHGTMPMESYPANAWGLFDMHGNVWEWVSDWYGVYPTEAVTDPKGPDEGRYRVLRGGSWDTEVGFCRSASRYRYFPHGGVNSMGFRVVME